jgi:hypothetical protein
VSENTTSDIGAPYGLPDVEVPPGHQATLRPVEGSDTPQVSVEPIPDSPEPDTSEPTTQAALDEHAQRHAETQQAFAEEHAAQVQAAMDAEVAQGGKSSNIGTDGRPHFPVMREREKLNADEPDHEPAECGTCGTEWPCEQAREIEQREAEQRGEQSPGVVQQPDAES